MNLKLLLASVVIIFIIIIVNIKEKDVKKEEKIQILKEKLTLGLAMQPLSALVFIAMDKGFFDKNGLDVKAMAFPSGKRALKEGLFLNEVDIAVASDIPIMRGCLENREFKIIASIGSTNNLNSIIARRDRNITTPNDLEYKWIATQKASAVHYFMHLFLRQYKINNTSNLFMKAEELPKAIASGEIDAFSMREPYISEAKFLLGDNAVIFNAPGIYQQSDLAVASNELVQKRPKVIKKFLKALIEAEQFVKANPKEAIEIVSMRLGSDIDAIGSIWSGLDLKVTLEESLLILLQSEGSWMIREKIVKTNDIPNFAKFIYLEGLKYIREKSVTIIE